MYPVIARTEMMYSTPLTCVVKSMSVCMVSSPCRLFFRPVAVLVLPVLPRQVRLGGPPPERHARPELGDHAPENPVTQQVERQADDGDGQKDDVQPSRDDPVDEQDGEGEAAVCRLQVSREHAFLLHLHQTSGARFPVGAYPDLLSAGEFLHLPHLLAVLRVTGNVPLMVPTIGEAMVR